MYSSPNKNSAKTEITKLSNGIRVATESSHGEFCTVGGIKIYIMYTRFYWNINNLTIKIYLWIVGINSGCRHEASYPNGVNHFLEKLAFGVSNSTEINNPKLKLIDQ